MRSSVHSPRGKLLGCDTSGSSAPPLGETPAASAASAASASTPAQPVRASTMGGGVSTRRRAGGGSVGPASLRGSKATSPPLASRAPALVEGRPSGGRGGARAYRCASKASCSVSGRGCCAARLRRAWPHRVCCCGGGAGAGAGRDTGGARAGREGDGAAAAWVVSPHASALGPLTWSPAQPALTQGPPPRRRAAAVAEGGDALSSSARSRDARAERRP